MIKLHFQLKHTCCKLVFHAGPENIHSVSGLYHIGWCCLAQRLYNEMWAVDWWHPINVYFCGWLCCLPNRIICMQHFLFMITHHFHFCSKWLPLFLFIILCYYKCQCFQKLPKISQCAWLNQVAGMVCICICICTWICPPPWTSFWIVTLHILCMKNFVSLFLYCLFN